MGVVLAVACVVTLAAVLWSCVGHRWAFRRLPEIASASGIRPAHVAGFSIAYRVLWHASGFGWALAVVGAAFVLGRHAAHLQWFLFAVLLLQSMAGNLAVLQAMPAIRRQLPGTPTMTVLLWIVLAGVLWVAWHSAQQ